MNIRHRREEVTVGNNKIHVWAPDLFSTKGGIQAFSRHFIEALSADSPSKDIRVLVKNDFSGDVPDDDLFRLFNVCGHWPAPLRTPRFALECLRYALLERPSLIVSTHLHFGPLARIVREITGTPYILVAHGIDAWRLNNRSRRSALRQADLTLAVSRYTRDWLVREAGLDSGRVRILPNTFSPEQFAISAKSPRLLQKYGLTPQTPVILTVCRLAGGERYKGYDQIIRALPRILREVPGARYLLVGTGPDRPRIEKLIAEAGVQDVVILAGLVPDEELVEHYNLCDVFAMPSKAEGFGIVYLEALACGKPALAGNQDGSCDALADGELGLLVDPDDTDEIAAELIRVLRREHPHPNIFRPELLRRRVAELFGFEAFKFAVADRLSPFLGLPVSNAEPAISQTPARVRQ
jgi:glycosyltransferase involved in cell wall biosynthesis